MRKSLSWAFFRGNKKSISNKKKQTNKKQIAVVLEFISVENVFIIVAFQRNYYDIYSKLIATQVASDML